MHKRCYIQQIGLVYFIDPRKNIVGAKWPSPSWKTQQKKTCAKDGQKRNKGRVEQIELQSYPKL